MQRPAVIAEPERLGIATFIGMLVCDNNGDYRLTVKISDPDHPVITKIKDRTR